MTPRTPQWEVFWALLSSSKHSGVPEDSKPPTFPSVGLHPHTWPKWGCDMRSLWALCWLGDEQWTCKEQGLAMTLVLENKLDLLMVMPIGHGKSAMFMIPPMVTNRTIIVVVPLTIFVSGHEANASRVGLWYATYGMDTITFDDLPSILFVIVECVATLRFVELAHTLNHL